MRSAIASVLVSVPSSTPTPRELPDHASIDRRRNLEHEQERDGEHVHGMALPTANFDQRCYERAMFLPSPVRTARGPLSPERHTRVCKHTTPRRLPTGGGGMMQLRRHTLATVAFLLVAGPAAAQEGG